MLTMRPAGRDTSPERRITMFGAIAIWIGLELAVGVFAVGAVWSYPESAGDVPAEAPAITAAEETAFPRQG